MTKKNTIVLWTAKVPIALFGRLKVFLEIIPFYYLLHFCIKYLIRKLILLDIGKK